MKRYQIYTDGSCSGNPGPGGWGVIILSLLGEETTLSGGERETTNNRMELTAALKALQHLGETPQRATLTTDSRYVINGITKWVTKWESRGWTTSSKKPVKNRDLWEELSRLNNFHEVEWKWVKGHSGNFYNNKVDSLAQRAQPR